MITKCDNCGWVGHRLQTVPAHDLHERLDEHGPEPEGECPRCGALAYEMKDELFNIFENADWTAHDRDEAQELGWDIFDLDSTGVLEIQALSEMGRFKSDAEAAAYVMGAAFAGSAVAQKALMVIAKAVVGSYLGYRGVDPSAPITLERAMSSRGPHEATLLRATYGT